VKCLDPPEIELETNKVHTGENKEAHLTCIVQGNPEPKVNAINKIIKQEGMNKHRNVENDIKL